MAILQEHEYRVCEKLSNLLTTNPFSPNWRQTIQEVLEQEYIDSGYAELHNKDYVPYDPNFELLKERIGAILRKIRSRLANQELFEAHEQPIVLDLIFLFLLFRFGHQFQEYIFHQPHSATVETPISWYYEYSNTLDQYLSLLPGPRPRWIQADHLFAHHYQWYRSYCFLRGYVHGNTEACNRLRQQLWQCIFSQNIRRHLRGWASSLSSIPLLIIGPSGSGKGYFARLLSLTSFLPFSPDRLTFASSFTNLFHSFYLPEWEPDYTHHVHEFFNRQESILPYSILYLKDVDKISSNFARYFGTLLLQNLRPSNFAWESKLTPWSYRKLVSAISQKDLSTTQYSKEVIRLLTILSCDRLVIPSLYERIEGKREELQNYVFAIIQQMGLSSDAYSLTQEIMTVIDNTLGFDYHWPGNFHELYTCIYQIMMQKNYTPIPVRRTITDPLETLILCGDLTADDILSYYITLTYQKCMNYQEVARRLKIDRRTVKNKINYELLHRLNPNPI